VARAHWNQALTSRNYDGVFLALAGWPGEMLRIRAIGQPERPGDGEAGRRSMVRGASSFRTGTELTFYLPTSARCSLKTQSRRGGLAPRRASHFFR